MKVGICFVESRKRQTKVGFTVPNVVRKSLAVNLSMCSLAIKQGRWTKC